MNGDKKKQKEWKNLEQLFLAMENCGRFLVLRNFEDLSDEALFMEGHEDIDFLCEDAAAVRKALDTRNDVCWRSPCHYYIRLARKDVKIGLRYVGDGYYDRSWEEAMLDGRRRRENGLFVPDEENYFYSLLYHALLQKKSLSDDYRERLGKMAAVFGISLKRERDFYRVLFEYMHKKAYRVVYPKDPTVPVNERHIRPKLRRGYAEWRLRRLLFTPRAMMKHFPGFRSK